MGTVFKRGNIWWIKYYRNGKSFRESSGSTKKTAAKKLLDRREGDISYGKLPDILFEKVTFDELAEEYLIDYELNQKKAIDKARQSVRHLKAEFQGTKVPEITTPRIQKYVVKRMQWKCRTCNALFQFNGIRECPKCKSGDLQTGASNGTINRELAALRRILNLGARQTPPKVDRVPYFPMLRENNVRKGFFELAVFLKFREALPDFMRPFVTFGFKTGWRAHEVASLTWSDVDLENGIVSLKAGETKNNEARTVYLDDELKTVLREQWELRKRRRSLVPYVFPNKDHTGSIINFRRPWNEACRATGIGYGYKRDRKYVQKWEGTLPPGPIFHDFRRTAVRNMVRAGVPERVAMMISGHKTRSVFDRYNIVNDADLKEASKRYQAYLEEQKNFCHGHNLGTICRFEHENRAANDS